MRTAAFMCLTGIPSTSNNILLNEPSQMEMEKISSKERHEISGQSYCLKFIIRVKPGPGWGNLLQCLCIKVQYLLM